MIRVQRIIVPDTQERCWMLFNADHPLIAPNQYLSYLHHLGRSPNTVRAYAHHLQAFSKFLSEENRDWTTLTLTELAKFVAWLRRISSSNGKSRSDTTINTILAAVGSFYEYQDRLGVETTISRSRRSGAKSPYKPFLHHISRTRPLRRAVMTVRATRRLPRVLSKQEVQALLDACIRRRETLRQGRPARHAAYVPPHARDRSVAGRLGSSIYPAASRARADPDHREHLCSSFERRSGENV